jgi:3-hydroxymyristoyl/3-hydroxydecanoyl-(acyl carrier protein) dehydratase
MKMGTKSTKPLPDILKVSSAGDACNQVILDLHIPADLSHFPGHFPSIPILPGVVQIDWAIHYARIHLAATGHFSMLENIKFLAPVLPNAYLELTLKWNTADTSLDFSFVSSEQNHSSGRIVFTEAV